MSEQCPSCFSPALEPVADTDIYTCGQCSKTYTADSLDLSPTVETDSLASGMVTLASDSIDQFQDKSPWAVSGVAIPERTVCKGGQGVEHYYPGSVLEEAADLLENQVIVAGYHEIDGSPDPQHVVGQVNEAAHQEGVGLVFSGEVIDPEVADKISQQYVDVSPTVARELGEYDESMGAQKVTQVGGFRDLAVVVEGQKGAEIQMGEMNTAEVLSPQRAKAGFDVLEYDGVGGTTTSGPPVESEAVEIRKQVLDGLERRYGLSEYAAKERAKLTTYANDTTMTTNTTGSDLDSLSRKKRQEVKDKLEKAEKMERRTPNYADTLRQEAAQIAGVDSYEEIEVDAL